MPFMWRGEPDRALHCVSPLVAIVLVSAIPLVILGIEQLNVCCPIDHDLDDITWPRVELMVQVAHRTSELDIPECHIERSGGFRFFGNFPLVEQRLDRRNICTLSQFDYSRLQLSPF